MNDPDPGHPTAEELHAFSRGQFEAAEQERIAAHLAGCAACCATLDDLTPRDALVTRLRDAVGEDQAGREADSARQSAVRALRRTHWREALTPRPPEPTAARSHATPLLDPPATLPAWQVGAYDLLGEVGRGGMGVVYKARHRELNRMVALKMVLAGEFASASERLRFRREAELAARVRHAHIVQVYEVGQVGDRPYLAMEWVEGGTLADRLDGTPWPARPAAHLVGTLARAIDAAHREGVIHRDLKPANILVQPAEEADSVAARSGRDGAGPLVGLVPKITDFGLARTVQGHAGLTRSGFTVGTPEYMAPEQAGGDSGQVGPPVDIYALGVILYQLLTGRPPFRGESPAEVLRASASAPPIALRRIESRVPRDLETIALKALEKEPAQRYRTAEALAEDLRRFLADEPILARPPSALDQLRKFARRHTGLVGGVLGVFTALLVGTIVSVGFAWRAAHNAREASYQTYRARLAAAAAALGAHDVLDVRRQLEAAPAELRDWEWRHLHSRLDDSSAVIPVPDTKSAFLFGAPDRLRVGAYTAAGLRLIDLAGGEQQTLPIGTGRGRQFTAMQTRRGLRVAVWTSNTAFDLLDEAGQVLCRVQIPGVNEIGPVGLSQDGTRLAVQKLQAESRQLAVFDVTSGKPVAQWQGHGGDISALTFSPDGTRLASAGEDRTVHLWDPISAALLATCRGHTSKVVGVAFRPDGARLVTTSADGTVRQWDAATGREVEPPYNRHSDEVGVAVYSPDGQWVASTGTDRTIRVWRATGQQDLAILHGHTWSVTGLAFAPDGRRLASLSIDRARGLAGDATARLWDLDPRATLPELRGHTSFVYPVAFSPDGRWIASGGWDSTVRLWDARTGEAACAPLGNGDLVKTLAFSPDSSRLVSARQDLLQVWEVATGRRLKEIQAPAPDVLAVAFHPDGATLAALDVSGGATVFDAATGAVVARLRLGAGHDTKALAYSPDGRWLAGVGADRASVCLFDAHTYELSAQFAGHDGAIRSVTFSPDSRRLASCSSDHTVRLWQIDSGQCQLLSGHTDEVFAAAFHPDGTRLATAGRDRAVWLWDLSTGEEVARLQGHTSYVWSLAFSPDGKTLVSGSGDFTVRLWDTAPLKARYEARREAAALRPAAERLVDSLLRQKHDPAKVVELLLADKALSEPLRHAARLEVLRRARPPESGK